MKLFVFFVAIVLMVKVDGGRLAKRELSAENQCAKRMSNATVVGNCLSKQQTTLQKLGDVGAPGISDEERVVRVTATCAPAVVMLQCMANFVAANCDGVDVKANQAYNAAAQVVKLAKDNGNAECATQYNENSSLF